MISFDTFRTNILKFLEKCYPSAGVFDAAAWEGSGENSILSDKSQSFIVPETKRGIVSKTLKERLQTNDWGFASTPGGCESLEGGHSAVETLYFLGELQKFSPGNKQAWVDYFNQFQDRETGYYLGPYIRPREHRSWNDGKVNTHPWDLMHDHMTACLCPTLMLLGGKSKFKLSEGSMTGRFLDQKYLTGFLYGRDWNHYQNDLNFQRHNPWWMGNEFWFPGTILWQITVWEEGSPAAKQARELLDQVWYRWHDENMGVTGFWYGDLKGAQERLWHAYLPVGSQPLQYHSESEFEWVSYQIMGGAHQLWFYDFDNHPIADLTRQRQTDILLALQNKYDHRFGLGSPDNPTGSNSNNCTDVDCMTLLANNYFRQYYRRPEIEKALALAVAAILDSKLNREGVLESRPSEAFTHNFNSYETFSPAGWGNILNQSFYTWAIAAACEVLKGNSYPEIQSFIDYDWPQVPSHWLWFPKNRKVVG